MSDTFHSVTEQDLDRAFRDDQFELWFQPQYDLANRDISALEGMIRWRHPTLGLLPPGLFLGALREAGRMGDLTRTVVRIGGEAKARWKREGHDWGLNLNISAHDLVEPSFALLAEAELDSVEATPDGVTFEVPEKELAELGKDALRGASHALRAGFGIAIEARGARVLDGNLIAGGPFTEFKLTGPTLLRMGAVQVRAGGGMVGDRVRDARDGGLPATAVGAESEDVLVALETLGFQNVQGNALFPASPLRDILNASRPEGGARDAADRSPQGDGDYCEDMIREARRARSQASGETEAA